MNRAGLRRFAAAAAAVVVGVAGAAAAQTDQTYQRTRRGSVTTLNSAAAQVCMQRLSQGDASDDTVRACTRAISEVAQPNDRLGLLINRGVLYLRRNEPAMALADFEAAIALNRREAEAHQNRGAALILLGQYGPAVAALTEALGLGVREPQKAYLNRGIAREALGDIRGAYEDFSVALEIEPGWAAANEEQARIVRQRQARLAARLEENRSP